MAAYWCAHESEVCNHITGSLGKKTGQTILCESIYFCPVVTRIFWGLCKDTPVTLGGCASGVGLAVRTVRVAAQRNIALIENLVLKSMGIER